MIQEAIRNLGTIMDDPKATQTERDVARRVMADITAGWHIARDRIHVLSGYIQRQQAQNRWGK